MEIENLYFGQTGSGVAQFCSAGLHPWYLTPETTDAAFNWLSAQAVDKTIIALGEAGLDKVTSTPWPLQMEAFQRCVDMAESVQKPLIIHCVRAFPDIIALKKQWKPHQPWIFHGFDKNAQTAAMLLKEGCFLSFGNAVFHEKSHAGEVLRQIPDSQFFLETDNAELTIEAVYQRAAALRGVSIEALELLIDRNFREVFSLRSDSTNG